MGLMRPSAALLRAADVFDLPGEAVAGVTRVTVTGTGRAHIENHRGLIDYSDSAVSVMGRRKMITVRGSRLELMAMTGLELVISGEISSVEYSE